MASDTDFDTGLGNGGETHQHISADGAHAADGRLTTNQGIRVSDNQNQLKVGSRGPVQLEDFVLREKIFHFDHGRIPDGLSMPGVRPHMAFSNCTNLLRISQGPTCSSGLANGFQFLPASRRWPEAQVRLIHRVTSEVSR
jgi:hypothetical protein